VSTNGFITFVAEGERKSAYNHSDSYPDWLGVRVLKWLRAAREQPDEVAAKIKRLRMVSDHGPGRSEPTAEQREALARFEDDGVASPDEPWYRLLRLTQGDPGLILLVGYAVDAGEPYGYEYIIDADQRTFSLDGHTWGWDHLPSDEEFLAEVG